MISPLAAAFAVGDHGNPDSGFLLSRFKAGRSRGNFSRHNVWKATEGMKNDEE